MNLRFLFSMILSLSFLTQQAAASNQTFDEKTFYLRSAAVFNELMSGSSQIDTRQLAKEDAALIELARKNRSGDVKIQFSDSEIAIQSKDMGVTIEWKDGDIYIGGIKHKSNPNISKAENIRNWAKNWQREHKHSAHFMALAISKAFAADAIVLGTPAAMSIDKVNTFADKALSAAEGIGAGSSFVGGSYAVGMVSGSGALVAGIMVATLVALDAVTCEAMARSPSVGNVSRERLNCYSAGLSLLKMNPRDRLYLQDIRCNGNQITVDLESQRYIHATRTFNFSNGNLSSVDEGQQKSSNSDKRESKSVKFSSSPDEKQKAILEALKPELNYYQSLCRNPDLLAQFRREAEKAHSGKEILTTTPAGTK